MPLRVQARWTARASTPVGLAPGQEAPGTATTAPATFLLGQALLAAGLSLTVSLGDSGVLRAVLGSGDYLTGVALIGLAVGTIQRGTAAAISVLSGLISLVPGLAGFLLPASVRDNVLLYLPSNAEASLTSVIPDPELLGSGAGAVVFAGWVVVPLLAAAVALRRRPV